MKRIAFRPNPSYAPKTYEQRVLHAFGGLICCEPGGKAPRGTFATLEQQVDFGYGVIGRLDKGGSINITRVRVSPGIWKTASFKIDRGVAWFFSRRLANSKTKRATTFNP